MRSAVSIDAARRQKRFIDPLFMPFYGKTIGRLTSGRTASGLVGVSLIRRGDARAGIPAPVAADGPRIDPQIESSDHLGIIRGQEHRATRVVSRTRPLAERHALIARRGVRGRRPPLTGLP